MKKTIIALAVSSMLTGCGFEIVDTGHRGVKTRFGEVIPPALTEGFYTYNPFTSDITDYDIRVEKFTSQTVTYTKDVQQAKVTYVINIAPDPSAITTLIKDIGPDYKERLFPQVVETTLKEIVGKWEAVELIENRDKAMAEAGEIIRAKLAEKNLVVSGFVATDITYTPEFEKAVEKKVVAIQEAVEEKNRTEKIREKKVQSILAAEAEAESIRIRSQALAQNKNLVQWEAIQKWDGKLPVYVLGGGAVPFINLEDKK
jgi:regulator of protease activity HflC (stomatin/prohibitin superfamily)